MKNDTASVNRKIIQHFLLRKKSRLRRAKGGFGPRPVWNGACCIDGFIVVPHAKFVTDKGVIVDTRINERRVTVEEDKGHKPCRLLCSTWKSVANMSGSALT